jgi:hypothetical protein
MWWNVEEVQREWGSFNSAKHNTSKTYSRVHCGSYARKLQQRKPKSQCYCCLKVDAMRRLKCIVLSKNRVPTKNHKGFDGWMIRSFRIRNFRVVLVMVLQKRITTDS